jgi:hypothetical protein
MASTYILSDNGVSSGSNGIKATGGNDGVLILQTTTAGGTATNALTIDALQQVGINTASPAYPLDITGAQIRQSSSSALGTRMTFVSTSTNGRTYQIGSNFVLGTGEFAVYDATAAATRLVIDSTGNVGIGAAPNNTSLTLNTERNLSWQWGNTYNYANIFNQANSAATVVASGYQRSATSNGFASSVPVTWARSALVVGGSAISLYADDTATVAVGTDITPTLRLKVDYLGNVTMPYQPAFQATGSGTQSWSSGSTVTQVFQMSSKSSSVPTARSGGYNTGTYRFTAPVSGLYMFFFGVTVYTSSGGLEGYFYKNGVTNYKAGGIFYTGSGNTYFTGTSSEVMYLTVNEYVDVRFANNNSVAISVDLGRSYFGGYLLG